jgi:YgiT-type zinc finger domain-containing protein
MKCAVCGSTLDAIHTDLPFKVRETAIVILKGLPVLQCPNCIAYLLSDGVIAKLDRILARVGDDAESRRFEYPP